MRVLVVGAEHHSSSQVILVRAPGAAREHPEPEIAVKSDLKSRAGITTLFGITRSLVVF
jgi:hypothetical protein